MRTITDDSTLRRLEAVCKPCTLLHCVRQSGKMGQMLRVREALWDIENDGLAGSAGQ